jgi:transcriptional regulator with XRE-family HTH domain
MKIGKVIQQTRLQKFPDATQAEFASMCGISQPHLSQIEDGTKKPSPETFQRICAKLDTPEAIVLWLATERKDVTTRKKKAFDMLKPAIDDLIKSFFTEDSPTP